MELLSRLIRARDAHGYHGMCRAVFNQVLRPYLTEILIGTQSLAFDRLEMDAALEQCNSRDARQRPVSSGEEARGISTKSYTDDDFERAVKQAISSKPSAT